MHYKTQLTKATKMLTIGDGRSVGVADVGDPEGHPVFFFHGWPGSRAGVLSMHDAATVQKVRLIGIDRPGIGLSSPKPGRTLLDWPDDVAEVADQMELQRFSVAGSSGGGPYALACAMKLKDRIDSVGIIAGMGPFELGIEEMRADNQRIFGMASRANGLLRFFLWLGIGRVSGDLEKLQQLIPKMMRDLPEPDRKVLEEPTLQPKFALELQEAFRQGARWVAKEGALYTQPWGFKLEDLPKLPTFLWHGELDLNVPVKMGRIMTERAPHIQGTFPPEHGHISLFAKEIETIFQTLKEAAQKERG